MTGMSGKAACLMLLSN